MHKAVQGTLSWVVKLVGGWIPVGDKPLREWFGKLVWVIGVIMAVNFVTGLFVRSPANTNQPTVIALPWSTVGNIDQHNKQKSEEVKRKWWQPIPYVAVAGEATSDQRAYGKVESGIRWDF